MEDGKALEEWLDKNAKLYHSAGSQNPLHHGNAEIGYPKWEVVSPTMQVDNASARKVYDKISAVVEKFIANPENLSRFEHAIAFKRSKDVENVNATRMLPEDIKNLVRPTYRLDNDGRISVRVPKTTMDYIIKRDAGGTVLKSLNSFSEEHKIHKDITNRLQRVFQNRYKNVQISYSPEENAATGSSEARWKITFDVCGPLEQIRHDNTVTERLKVIISKEARTAKQMPYFPSAPQHKQAELLIKHLVGRDQAADIRIEAATTDKIELSCSADAAEQIIRNNRDAGRLR